MSINDIANGTRYTTFPTSILPVEPGTRRYFHCSFSQGNIERGNCVLADSPTGLFVKVDAGLCELLGFPCNALLAINLRQLIIDPGYSSATAPERLLSVGDIDGFVAERLLVRSDGSTLLITINCREHVMDKERSADRASNKRDTMSTVNDTPANNPAAEPAIHQLPLLVISFLSGGIAEYISPQWSDYTGIAGRNLLGLKWLTTIHQDDRRHWMTRLDVATEDAGEFDCRIRGTDGRYRWFHVNTVLNSSLPDEHAQWTATCIPIDERRREEMRISSIATAAESLFKAENTCQIAAAAAEAIAPALADWCRIDLFEGEQTTAETVVVHLDPAGEQIIRQLSLPRMDNVIRIGERNRIPIDETLSSPTADTSQPTGEMYDENESATTSFEVASLVSVPLLRGEEIIGCIYAGTDDERPELQRSDMRSIQRIAEMAVSRLCIAQHISRLNEDHTAKDRFIAVLGHELRTPLAAVQTALEIVVDSPLSDDARTSLEIAQRNISLEIDLLNDLLDVTRLKDDKLRLDLTVVDLHTLLRDVLAICRLNAPSKTLQFELDLRATHYHIAGDRTRIHQIFWNLLKNAIMHTDQGREITIRTRNHQGELVVEIEDSGIGLTATELAMIQELFAHHWDRWPVISNGLGLGLSICASLVHLHHGCLSVASRGTGTGATFTVALPCMEQLMNNDDDTPTVSTAGNGHRIDQQRILLVDDHVDMITVYRQLLQHRGYEVLVAFTMAEALELAGRESFDILISDIGLPDGDGIELMRLLTEHGPIRAIAVSGYGTQADIQRSLAAGFALHLVKPFSVKLLNDAILRLLESDGEEVRG